VCIVCGFEMRSVAYGGGLGLGDGSGGGCAGDGGVAGPVGGGGDSVHNGMVPQV
jgi:hypothetical protein